MLSMSHCITQKQCNQFENRDRSRTRVENRTPKRSILEISSTNLIYKSCTNENCLKKVDPVMENKWYCSKCRTEKDGSKWQLSLILKLKDSTGEYWATAFGDVSTYNKIFHFLIIKVYNHSFKHGNYPQAAETLLNVDGNKMVELVNSDTEALQDLLESRRGIRLQLSLISRCQQSQVE